MNDRLDERGALLQGLHWPQPVALAPDEAQPARARDSAYDDRDSHQLFVEESAPPQSVLLLLVTTTLAALVVMAITVAALYFGGVFAPR